MGSWLTTRFDRVHLAPAVFDEVRPRAKCGGPVEPDIARQCSRCVVTEHALAHELLDDLEDAVAVDRSAEPAHAVGHCSSNYSGGAGLLLLHPRREPRIVIAPSW